MTSYLEQIEQLDKTVNELSLLIQSVRNPLFHAELNLQEKSIICYLGENADKTMKELSLHFGVGFSTMTGVIGRLEKKGIIERWESSTDRRVVLVRLEDKWQRTYETYIEEQEKLAKIVFETITKKKFDSIMKLFSETTHNVSKRMAITRRFI